MKTSHVSGCASMPWMITPMSDAYGFVIRTLRRCFKKTGGLSDQTSGQPFPVTSTSTSFKKDGLAWNRYENTLSGENSV